MADKEEIEVVGVVSGAGAEGGGEAGAAADKKKKKKKKPTATAAAGAADKEKPKQVVKNKKDDVRKGGPSKKAIAAIQEKIAKQKEEEEKFLREEAEKERLLEEAENARMEKLRLEKEKKERKKEKEKEKKERLKAEGKYLTPKQKLEKQRAQERLEILKAQGIELPTTAAATAEKKPRLGTRIRTKKANSQLLLHAAESECQVVGVVSVEELVKSQAGSGSGTTTSTSSPDAEVIQEQEGLAPVPEGIKEDWDAESSSEDAEEETEKEGDSSSSKENSQSVPIPEEPREGSQGSFGPKDVTVTEPPTGTIENETGKPRICGDQDEDKAQALKASDGEATSDDHNHSHEATESKSNHEELVAGTVGETKREKALHRIQRRREENEHARSLKNLRCPVVCVLGHVDTGKTKILDKLRKTHVQDGEAGGITQQIGATNVPIDAIKEQTKFVKGGFKDLELKLPGLLIIDTPGHESFSNLRSRGSSLCDIAILVVDIMHGLEPQTIESINLLKSKRTPFVVALNKIDRLYDWRSPVSAAGGGGGSGISKVDVREVIASQPKSTLAEFDKRVKETIAQFALQSLNTALLGENPDPKTYITMVPTSAATGDGMGNLMALIVELSQTMLAKQLMYSKELLATVLEVKALPGLGTTIDLILLNGTLAEGETLVLAGSEGPIVTQIRSLLTPQPMKELRVKNTYIEYKKISGAVGVKLAAKDLEKAIAGLNVLVAHHPDEIEICKEEVTKELSSALSSLHVQERGVYVQASTLGSLEALLQFLRTSEIPYSGIRIGPVVKKDVMRASAMLEHDSKFAVILAFDVKIEKDAQEMADSVGVRIFQADIIYHLFDKFMAYREQLKLKEREQFKHLAVFPCKLRILPQCIFKTRDPIIVGVSVEAGVLRDGTPLCVQDATTLEVLDIGRVASIECNHKSVESARKGQEVCIKIEPMSGETPKLLGRHFLETDLLLSKITRESIDVCKEYFRADLQKTDWQLIVELKKMFQIL